MAEAFRIQVSIDEPTRDKLRRYAGTGAASVAWMIARLVEAGLAEKKRLLSGINRRLELALRGGLEEHDRAGMVQVPLSPKLGLELAGLAPALDHSAGGIAALITKVVLDDHDWALAVFSEAMTEKNKGR